MGTVAKQESQIKKMSSKIISLESSSKDEKLTYYTGAYVSVTGSVREVLADFGSFVGSSEEEIKRSNGGVLPQAEIIFTLDAKYIQEKNSGSSEGIYSARMTYGGCVENGLGYRDRVLIKGKINTIPEGIGLVFSCEDPDTSVSKLTYPL